MKRIVQTLLFVVVLNLSAQPRIETDLSGKGWKLIQDKDAQWKNDPFFLPPVNVSALPVNLPTGGWSLLSSPQAVDVSVPGTAEEYLQKISGPKNTIIGVTWWTLSISIPKTVTAGKILLRFEATRYRSEIFVNQQLVGYDFIGNTPFEVDITKAVKPGETAQLAVRITNPGGIYDWKDNNIKWGKRDVAGSLGFGGITGRVKLVVCDLVYIDDIYVQNTPVYTTVNAEISLNNSSKKETIRNLTVRVVEKKNLAKEIFRKELKSIRLKPGNNLIPVTISAPDARLWDVENPNLYVCETSLQEKGKITDNDSKTFGFRWFELAGIGKDAMLRLNGKRIVLRTAISWGFWPTTGNVPTPELAEKQIRVAKEFGLNMLNFHRCIGQPLVLEKADELGLLYYEEPGNYAAATQFPSTRTMMHERLMRMVKRDRSHPSMIMYCMQNEVRDVPDSTFQVYKNDMRDAHRIDPSRTIVRTSGWALGNDIDDQAKLNMRPFDTLQHMNGWYDFHRAVGPHTWMQSYYKSPDDYYSKTDNKKEIVYWGEEGALSSPPRIDLIKKELDKSSNEGWDGALYKEQYSDFANYFSSKKLNAYFPTLDALTSAMGAISLEHQGRKIENARINNIADGYAVNGWESEILENHSGIVDCYRNPKADPAILSYFNQPLYIAVKTRQQVVEIPGSFVADFYIVNEKNVNGEKTLQVSVKNPEGKVIFTKEIPVTVTGGDVYGELLVKGVEIPIQATGGIYPIDVKLLDKEGKTLAKGRDEVLGVDWKSAKLPGAGAVWESGSTVFNFLKNEKAANVSVYKESLPKLDWAVVARSPKGGDKTFVPTEQLLDLSGKNKGVKVTYFLGADFEKQVAQQTEPMVNLTVNEGATPHPAVPSTFNYSIRWDGQLIPPYTGAYTFELEYGYGGEGVFEINGVKSTNISKMNCKLTINLEAGKPVMLKAELRHKRYSGAARLYWSIPDPNAFDAQKLIDRVKNEGTTLVIIENAASWMDLIMKNTNVKYSDKFAVGTNWLGGTHFVKQHPLFKDLPVNCGMSWPYEAVVKNGNERIGLQLEGEELVVGNYHCYPQKLGTAVGVIPCGKGKIIFSTLEIFNNLQSKESTAGVARKLLCNYILSNSTNK
ncbi:MAG: sugar-binding domain-containing protein [Bacteroidales bacterium]